MNKSIIQVRLDDALRLISKSEALWYDMEERERERETEHKTYGERNTDTVTNMYQCVCQGLIFLSSRGAALHA